jgi:uncharacterized protein (TIGR00303 family)
VVSPTPLTAADADVAAAWQGAWRQRWRSSVSLLLLAGTDTASVPGISAAGGTPRSRRLTAAADAELLLLGPAAARPHALPPLPAGVSPALISWVVRRELGLVPLVIDAGAAVAPAVMHVRLPGAAPARCLSGGRAMAPADVRRSLHIGERWGRRLAGRPLLLAECVPGGTTTALAVLEGLGVSAFDLVSGSLRQPPRELRRRLVAAGLRRGGALPAGRLAAADLLAAVGDPMLPLASGLLAGAVRSGSPVMLAGGSQMAAVLATALERQPPGARAELAARAAVVTTAWLAGERGGGLVALLERIGRRWGVSPLAFSAGLRFRSCRSVRLRDYERGFVKEGVGAGGFAVLWELSGRCPNALAAACDAVVGQLH